MRSMIFGLALVLTFPAVAAESCTMTTSVTNRDMVVVPYSTPMLTGYVVSDTCQLDLSCIYSIWFYEETNGVSGLQRRDDSADNTCGGRYQADRIL